MCRDSLYRHLLIDASPLLACPFLFLSSLFFHFSELPALIMTLHGRCGSSVLLRSLCFRIGSRVCVCVLWPSADRVPPAYVY